MKMKSSILKLKRMRSITSYAKRRKLDMSDSSDSLLDRKDIKSTSNDQSPVNSTDAISNGLTLTSVHFSAKSKVYCQWDSINWLRAYRMVKNLRFRIFKATKRGDVKTVRRLQKLLIRSYESRLLAVRQISQNNPGKKTPGFDKSLLNTSKERGELVDLLEKTSISTWKPDTTQRIYLSKDNRPFKTPSIIGFTPHQVSTRLIIDLCLQYIVKSALEPEWEARFEGSTYGFRPGRLCHDALQRIYTNYFAEAQHTRDQKIWVLYGNIIGCFQKIYPKFLLNAMKHFPEKDIIERWLKCGNAGNNIFHHAPIGTVISPLLANIALHGMDEPLGCYPTHWGETRGEKNLVRYGDAFLVFCKNEMAAKETYIGLNKWLSIRGFSLSREKTKITHIDQGFDFLGTTIRRFRISDVETRLLIKPSKKSTIECRSKLKRLWNQGQGKPVNLTINKLNAFIRGWANYFRPYVSKEVFSSLDNYMFTQAVRFTRRTHPLKSWQWRKKQYFGHFHFGRKTNWVFGEKKTGHFIHRFSWFPIERHTMVKGDNSPCDPDLADYWLKRQANRVSWEFTQKIDMKIASKQKHVCPLCKESLYIGEELQKHHKVPVKNAGPDTISNIVFLHLLCHQQIQITSKVLSLES